MILCNSQITPRVSALLARYNLHLKVLPADAEIPGSYWGAPEAGLVKTRVYARNDTPLHSVLHEAAHAVCMDPERRAQLHTDAGGDYAEENAVCYIEILWAQQLGISLRDICADMDAWGYTFRLGSALAWFKEDAQDAHTWLAHYGLIEPDGTPTWRYRDNASVAIVNHR